jgi:hypothetical protein
MLAKSFGALGVALLIEAAGMVAILIFGYLRKQRREMPDD